jgi:hypothetical protein
MKFPLIILFLMIFISCSKTEEFEKIDIEGHITLLDEFGDSSIFVQSGVRVLTLGKRTVTDYLGNFSIIQANKVEELVFRKNYYDDFKIDLTVIKGNKLVVNKTMFHKPSTTFSNLYIDYEDVDGNLGVFQLTFNGIIGPLDEHFNNRSFEIFIDYSPNVGPDSHVVSYVFEAGDFSEDFTYTLDNAVDLRSLGFNGAVFFVAYGRSSFLYEGYPVVLYANRSNLFEFSIP